jgi:hypothetical protein
MRHIFDRYVLFENVAEEVTERWKKIYLHFLKKMTFSSKGKRLLLKNPSNTARIKELLELFPDAKFIHVCRNPYVVYSSTMNWLDKEMTTTALQKVDEAAIRENALINYEKLMHKYLEDRHLIPEENLLEMRFEDFEADPIAETQKIYKQFALDFDEQTQERMHAYMASVAGYKKNKYRLDRKMRQEIARRWGFVIKRWNYQPPQV